MTILTSAYHSLKFEKSFLMLLRRSDFYMNIRVSHAFFEFMRGLAIGVEAPQKIPNCERFVKQRRLHCLSEFINEKLAFAQKHF